jgi:hypothetical protein
LPGWLWGTGALLGGYRREERPDLVGAEPRSASHADALSADVQPRLSEEHPSNQPQHHQFNEPNLNRPPNQPQQPKNQPTQQPTQNPNSTINQTTNPMIDTDLHWRSCARAGRPTAESRGAGFYRPMASSSATASDGSVRSAALASSRLVASDRHDQLPGCASGLHRGVRLSDLIEAVDSVDRYDGVAGGDSVQAFL